MLMRRGMLGSSGGAVGEFTQYEKKILTFPNVTNSNRWADNPSISCSFTPKFIVFYANSNSTVGCIYAGEIYLCDKGGGLFATNFGAVRYISSASSVDTGLVYNYNTTQNNCCYYVDDENNFHIDRASGNGYWSNTYEYTFEIYG